MKDGSIYKKYKISFNISHLFLLSMPISSISLFFRNSIRSFRFLFITRAYFSYIPIAIVFFNYFLIFASFSSQISSSISLIFVLIILFSPIRLIFMYSWLMFFLPVEFFMKSCSRFQSFICKALLSLATMRQFFSAI